VTSHYASASVEDKREGGEMRSVEGRG